MFSTAYSKTDVFLAAQNAYVVDSIDFMFTKAIWDKSFIFNGLRLRREWLLRGGLGDGDVVEHATREGKDG